MNPDISNKMSTHKPLSPWFTPCLSTFTALMLSSTAAASPPKPSSPSPTPQETLDQKSEAELRTLTSEELDEIITDPATVEDTLNSLPPKKQAELAKSPAAEDNETLQNYRAIRPGVRLIGDAFGRANKGVGEQSSDDRPVTLGGSFGLGMEFTTQNFETFVIVNKGVDQNPTLTSAHDFGEAMLLPQTELVSATIDATWIPARWYDTLPLGFRAYTSIAGTSWELELAPGTEADPDAMAPATSPITVSANVTTIASGLGLEYVWSIRSAAPDNFIQLSLFAGASVHAAVADAQASRDLRTIQASNPDDETISALSDDFINIALDLDDNRPPVFVGTDLGFSLRLNQVEVIANLPWVQGDVPGLSRFRFVPMLSLRGGAQLAALPYRLARKRNK